MGNSDHCGPEEVLRHVNHAFPVIVYPRLQAVIQSIPPSGHTTKPFSKLSMGLQLKGKAEQTHLIKNQFIKRVYNFFKLNLQLLVIERQSLPLQFIMQAIEAIKKDWKNFIL